MRSCIRLACLKSTGYFSQSMRPLIPTLVIGALLAASVTAQPLEMPYPTLEARMAQAEQVVVATIGRVSEEALERERKTPSGGNYPLTLNIREVLKGDLKGTVDDLDPKTSWEPHDLYRQWADAGTSLLCFLRPIPHGGGRRYARFFRLGEPVPAEAAAGKDNVRPLLISMDFSPIKDDAEILNRARAYGKAWPQVQETEMIYLPQLLEPERKSTGNYLIVPVEPTLEARARRLIATPDKFLPEEMARLPEPREMLRSDGVRVLRHFKSDANADLLRAILADAGESVTLRTRALEVLLSWDVDVPLPETAQEITDLYLAGPAVTEKGMKLLAGLKRLRTLNLQGTKVTAAGLRELAGVRTLASVYLNSEQLGDDHLRALREMGLLHILANQTGGGKKSAEDVTSFNLRSSPITDAGLRELAGLRNLVLLDLCATGVTDAGLRDLAGFGKLSLLTLQSTRVTEAGISELKKSLPNCRISQ